MKFWLPNKFFRLIATAAIGVGIFSLPVSSWAASLESILRPVDATMLATATSGKATESSSEKAPSAPVRVTLSAVLRQLEADAAATLTEGDQLELTSTAQWRILTFPAGTEWTAYTETPMRADPRGNWFPLVRLEVDGEMVGSWRLPIKVALYRSVWMTYQRLGRGDLPVAPAVRPVVRNIYQERGSPIPSTVNLATYELLHPVVEGRLLSWSDIGQRPLVRRGAMVEVSLENGGLKVQMPAQSLQDGVVGDQILVRNIRSRREFTGIITGPNEVRIHQN